MGTSKHLSLADRSLAAVKWNYFGVIARVAAQLVAQVVLARVLGPESMGLFAASLLFIGLGALIVELGLGSTLVQRKELTDGDVHFAFTWVLITGLVATVLIYFCSGWLGSFFNMVGVSDVLRMLAPAFFLQALSVVPLAMMRRDLAFKPIQFVQVTSYIISFIYVGVGMALNGYGVWSLVAAWLAQSALMAILAFKAMPISCRFVFTPTQGHRNTFAPKILLTNLTNWVVENLDNVLVGRLFGSSALGLYAVSYNLVRNPTNHLVVTLQTVLFPATSRAQDRLGEVRRAYLTTVSGIALVTFPIFWGVAVVADTMVLTVFGKAWGSASIVLTPLALAMPFHALMAVAGPVLWGRAVPGKELKVQIATAVLFVVAIYTAGRFSLQVLAWSVLLVYLIRFIAMTSTVATLIELNIKEVFIAIKGGLITSLLVCLVLILADSWLSNVPPLIRLSFEIFLGAASLLTMVLGLPKVALARELIWVLNKIIAKFPFFAGHACVRRIVNAHLEPSERRLS